MTTEELTAEERELLDEATHRGAQFTGGAVARLLRLYDAALARADGMAELCRVECEAKIDALARAEAAESKVRAARNEGSEEQERDTAAYVRHVQAERKAAESRLAEATALNQDSCEKWQAAQNLLRDLRAELEDRGGSLTRKTWNRLETYVDTLSATPAQAAEPDPRCPGGCVMSVPGAGIEPACLYCFKRAQAAEPWQCTHCTAGHAASEPCPAQAAGLLRPVNEPQPPGCHCPPDVCHAPRVMGRQMPCRRAPAQAAEPEMVDSSEPVERQHWKLRRAQEKIEHPDTIALRECRAELEQDIVTAELARRKP